MKINPLPSIRELERIFEYNAETGLLLWKARSDVPRFTNTRLAGKKAGRICGRKHQVNLYGTQYPVHRVIFKMAHGTEPEQIDHIDGDHFNNKIDNLRAATASQNSCNQKKPKNNSSGFKGVDFYQNRFRARISVRRRRVFIGFYDTAEEAAAAYRAAASDLHGEFARIG